MTWLPSRMHRSSPEMYTLRCNEKDPISKIKALLNKLTEDKFLAISLEMNDLFRRDIHSEESMTKVATSIITKATREPHYSKIYTELSLSIISEKLEFKTVLLKVLQSSFTKLCNHRDLPNRMRGLTGCATVIGEFYNHELLSQRIYFLNVANYLFEELSEDSLGALCVLIATSRNNLKESKSTKESLRLYIEKIDDIRKDKSNGVSSRMRFLMLDVVEDRKKIV